MFIKNKLYNFYKPVVQVDGRDVRRLHKTRTAVTVVALAAIVCIATVALLQTTTIYNWCVKADNFIRTHIFAAIKEGLLYEIPLGKFDSIAVWKVAVIALNIIFAGLIIYTMKRVFSTRQEQHQEKDLPASEEYVLEKDDPASVKAFIFDKFQIGDVVQVYYADNKVAIHHVIEKLKGADFVKDLISVTVDEQNVNDEMKRLTTMVKKEELPLHLPPKIIRFHSDSRPTLEVTDIKDAVQLIEPGEVFCLPEGGGNFTLYYNGGSFFYSYSTESYLAKEISDRDLSKAFSNLKEKSEKMNGVEPILPFRMIKLKKV